MGGAEKLFATTIARLSFSPAIVARMNLVNGSKLDHGIKEYTATPVIHLEQFIFARKHAVNVRTVAKIRMEHSLPGGAIATVIG